MLLALAKPKVSGTSVSLPVVMDFQGYLSKGVIAHLSLDGLSLITDVATSEGSSISIQFCFARDFAYMFLAGRVESVIDEEGSPTRLWRVVAKFIDLADPERAILASCLQEFESATATERRQRRGAGSKLKAKPVSLISLFVTDDPYFFHYQRNGPPDQQQALAVSPSNGRTQQNRPADAVPCAHPTSLSHSRALHGFCKMLHVIRDLLVQILPPTVGRVLAPRVSFAFIAHPRDINDVYRKFPIARFLPPWLMSLWLEYQWPIVGSYITGLKAIGGKTMTGAMLFSPLTTEQMLRNPRLARKRVYQTVRLAEKMGARIAGLGAFTSIITKDGKDLQGRVKVGLTTGNAHSAAMAVQNVLNAAALTNLSLPHSTAAIVGAAGSVGSVCAKLLSRLVAKLILVDIKKDELKHLLQQLQDQSVQLKGTSSLDAIRQADVVIAATNCPRTLIAAEHLKPGAIVIDAAQPPNVSEQVPHMRRDVLVIESAIVNTPGVDCNFDLGLGPGETFGCLSESMILTAIGWQGDYSLGKADPRQAAEMIRIGRELGFRLANFRNSEGYITETDLTRVARARRAESVCV
jgi:fatty aldehyde-generating acyl-ACP reductase